VAPQADDSYDFKENYQASGNCGHEEGGEAEMILVRRLLGDVLRGRRQRSGRTLRQLAATARVSPGYLSEVERGQKEPSSELLAAICDALEVRLSDVLLELSTELAAAELAAELEAAELGTLVSPDGRPQSRVPMPARSRESRTAGTATAQRSPMVVGVGAAAPRRAGNLPTAKIPTAVITAGPASSRPGNRPASGGPVRSDPRVAPKRGTVPQAALGPMQLPYLPGAPLPGPENPYTFGTARVSTPTGR
jgi:transcriptional regulator with XRE-family HTH domain